MGRLPQPPVWETLNVVLFYILLGKISTRQDGKPFFSEFYMDKKRVGFCYTEVAIFHNPASHLFLGKP
jgi:hypothetical protein